MRENDILLLKYAEIEELLNGREAEIAEAVKQAYLIHDSGDSSLPHSVFLRFPNDDTNRIIGLPAYVGGDIKSAGIKWIASFPGNTRQGIPRASAAMILNSLQTGRPTAILEASLISAKRTAASAAIAGSRIHQKKESIRIGVIGSGLINFEVVRFLLALIPGIVSLEVYDKEPENAENFATRVSGIIPGHVTVNVRSNIQETSSDSSLITFATTAIKPYFDDISICAPGTTILHVSLRDLTPDVILRCDNVVDDVDHVCRAQTSVHLAEQQQGNRDFIRCTLADVLNGTASSRADNSGITVFSPFGLGVLDLAVAQFVCAQAIKSGIGTWIESFLPRA